MAIPGYIQKTLQMKPEVSKIFDDLEDWHDQCRFNLMNFDPADLYRSPTYKDYARRKHGNFKYQGRNGNAKFHNKPRRNDNFSR